MARRSELKFLQRLWPIAAVGVIVQSAAIAWGGRSDQVTAWISAIPSALTIITLMAAGAGVGPLVSDGIKAKAGILGKEDGDDQPT